MTKTSDDLESIVVGYIAVAIAIVLVGATEWIAPDFFNYPYWDLQLGALVYYWPLLIFNVVYSSVMAHVDDTRVGSDKPDLCDYAASVLKNTLVGVWEELGYRWTFICLAMIVIYFWDSVGFLVSLLALVLGLGVLVLALFARKIEYALAGLVVAALSFLALWMGADPLTKLYEWIIVPIANIATFGLMSNVFYGSFDKALVFGAVMANIWFRDGHGYQGVQGIIRSWYMGLIFLYTMLHFGIGTAIVLHALSNISKEWIQLFWLRFGRVV